MFRFSLGAAAVATMMFIGVIDADAQGRTPVPLASLPGVMIQKVQLASTETQAIDVDVVSGCVSNVAMFQIVNVGEAWPRMGKLHIIRISNGNSKTLAKRSMRFAAGQKASFRLKDIGPDTVAIFVEPSWYERPFKFDAEVTCD
jgi:hypothetical protein